MMAPDEAEYCSDDMSMDANAASSQETTEGNDDTDVPDLDTLMPCYYCKKIFEMGEFATWKPVVTCNRCFGAGGFFSDSD